MISGGENLTTSRILVFFAGAVFDVPVAIHDQDIVSASTTETIKVSNPVLPSGSTTLS